MKPANSFAPGPWKINGPSRLRDDSVQILDAEGETVTHVVADDTLEIEDGSIAEVLSGKAKANARLIAAAPDLLASVTEAAIRCAGLHGGRFREHKCITCSRWLEVIEKAVGP